MFQQYENPGCDPGQNREVGAVLRSVRITTLGTVRCYVENRELVHLPKQRIRCAVLIYLAVEREATREAVQNMFWSDRDENKGRAALKQTIYELRRQLGDDWIESQADRLKVADRITVDLTDFIRAAEANDACTALALYQGAFLQDFWLPPCKPLEFWTDRERSRTVRLHRAIRRQRLSELLAQRKIADALTIARDWVELEPLEDEAQHRLIELLAAIGERSEGLRQAESYEKLLLEDDLEPLEETRKLVERLRAGAVTALGKISHVVDPVDESARNVAPSPATVPANAPRLTPVRSHRLLPFLVGAVPLVPAVAFAVHMVTRDPRIVLAVGEITDHTQMDSLKLTLTMRGLLESELPRIRGVDVLSESRWRELQRLPGDSARAVRVLELAARRAGATELLKVDIYRLGGDSLRLDLQRENLTTHFLRRSVTASGTDPFLVVSIAVEELAKEMNRVATGKPLREVGTRSTAAWSLYQEGLHALYAQNILGAKRLFTAALSEDSTFAMAAYQASRAAFWNADYSGRVEPLRRAVRLSAHASDRERLLILTEWAEVRNDTAFLALADTLARRFPGDPLGSYKLGYALSYRGEFAAARRWLRTAVLRDSAALRGGRGSSWLCQACDALSAAIWNDMADDSMASAEWWARWWVARDSTSVRARNVLSTVLQRQGRTSEALAMQQTGWREAGVNDDAQYLLELDIRTGDYAAADEWLKQKTADSRLTVREDAYRWQTISLRQQGRFQDALAASRRYRAAFRQRAGERAALISAAPEQQVLFELGQFQHAIALGDSMLSRRSPNPGEFKNENWNGEVASYRAWTMVHTAESVAALRDTVRLARLADSVESVGRQSGYVRDRRLHHYVRGLTWLARRDTTAAIRELRAALYSPTLGYTRTNYLLGRLLIARGQAREAIAVLEPALRGGLEACNLFVTRTELYEALGNAYTQADERQKAREAFARVAAAWSGADPSFRARAGRAARLAAFLRVARS